MEIYDSTTELEAAIGQKLGRLEADWGYRLSGYDQPGGNAGGWLVTYAHEDQGRTGEGYLIAYEINSGNAKTGRVGLLREWTNALEEKWFATTFNAEWFESEKRNTDGETDLHTLELHLNENV